jgi:hypothetical protein
MRAEIRSIRSSDADVLDSGLPVEEWQPSDPETFYVYLEIEVGVRDELGEDVFGVDVCSPKWLLHQEGAGKGYLWARHRLILWRWNFKLVRQAIEELVRRVEGPDWTSVANELARYMKWEFEDYPG